MNIFLKNLCYRSSEDRSEPSGFDSLKRMTLKSKRLKFFSEFQENAMHFTTINLFMISPLYCRSIEEIWSHLLTPCLSFICSNATVPYCSVSSIAQSLFQNKDMTINFNSLPQSALGFIHGFTEKSTLLRLREVILLSYMEIIFLLNSRSPNRSRN